MIHPSAECKNKNIPESTRVWQFCVIFGNCKIGENCNICAHVVIENDVCIGNNVTIKSGVQVWDGITLEDNVFVGPNVTFTNDNYPRSKQPFELKRIIIKKGASIGAGSVVIGGIIIGENSMIGAGSVVTKDVPKNELWFGNPAKRKGVIDDNGNILYI